MGREIRAGVQTARNRAVGVCDAREHVGDRSGKYVSRGLPANYLSVDARRGMNRRAKRAKPLITRTPHIARHPG